MPRICPDCSRKFDDTVEKCPDHGTPTFQVQGPAELVGQTLDGRFTVRGLLGTGGMGVVYRAFQVSTERDVALKVLRPEISGDEQAIRRFFREARAASHLANPHTITVFDFGQTRGGLLFIAMELLEGRTLGDEMKQSGPMEAGRAVRIVDQVLDSLLEAHAEGIVHRDMKPDNIFLLRGRGADDFVKVLDFGIAKVANQDAAALTGSGLTFGTPVYMSPEQATASPLDGRSDLYSVGVILFEMLAGKPPWWAETPLAIAMRKIQEKPPLVYHVNPEVRVRQELQDLLLRLLSPIPADRPADAAEVKRLLKEALEAPRGNDRPLPPLVVRGNTAELAVQRGEAPAAAAADAAGDVPDVLPDEGGLPDDAIPAGTGFGRRRWPWLLAAAAVLLAAALAASLRGGGGPAVDEVPPPAALAAPDATGAPTVAAGAGTDAGPGAGTDDGSPPAAAAARTTDAAPAAAVPGPGRARPRKARAAPAPVPDPDLDDEILGILKPGGGAPSPRAP